ncbi:MAG: flagellar basal-body MS-ring/collar protein FliF [bacterium]|nr:flagellar basal-body MS-ring/collar protein FliF [bacterium]MDY2830151.1 flagellar basal-body MS-ring/collar protein FliF [Alphaproteobacteria bacterium]
MNNILQTVKDMSPSKLASMAAIIVFLLSFFIYVAVQMSGSEYAVLYTDLDLEDAKQIVAKLESSNIKYKLSKNGTEIMVPAEAVNRMRIETADLALASKGANVGYEVFDHTDALGSTSFVQNVNLLRALEGELARTIRSVDNIKSARVHLVMPKREIFSREEQTPTASVVIKTKNGSLSPQSIQSIQKLVAAAVPKLDMKNISIVDSNGNLLTEFSEEQNEVIKKSNNETMRLEQERKITQKVQHLLEKSLGAGKAQAQVNIEMDFDEVVTNEEIYDPNSQVVRSQATISEEGSSNQGMSQPVTVAQNIPNGDNSLQSSGGGYDSMSKTEETINYEISKIVRNKIKNTGTIHRLTAAVSVDGTYKRDENGKLIYIPRSQEEMEQITALVKSAVGYDANRGDMVEVENLQFNSLTDDVIEKAETLYLGFSKAELMRMGEGLGVAIVAILVILLVIRPLINNAFEVSNNNTAEKLISSEGDSDNLLLSNFLNDNFDETAEELVNLNKVDGRIKVSSLKKLNETVEKNPDAAVNVIRGWLYNNEG